MLGTDEKDIGQHAFQLSGFTRAKKIQLQNVIEALGGVLLPSEQLDEHATHIICGKPSRSEKFMGGMALGKWILTADFITESHLAGHWLPEEKYEWNLAKADLVTGVENGRSMLAANTRWREHISNGGAGAFFGWRAAVLVEDPRRKIIYKRLLQFGGAAIVEMRLPVRRPNLIARDVSHVFAEANQKDAVQGLLNNGVLCLLPVYIAVFLIMDPPPEPRSYLVGEVTPPVVKTSPSKTGPSSQPRGSQATSASQPTKTSASQKTSVKRPVSATQPAPVSRAVERPKPDTKALVSGAVMALKAAAVKISHKGPVPEKPAVGTRATTRAMTKATATSSTNSQAGTSIDEVPVVDLTQVDTAQPDHFAVDDEVSFKHSPQVIPENQGTPNTPTPNRPLPTTKSLNISRNQPIKRKMDPPVMCHKRRKLDLPWIPACPDIVHREPQRNNRAVYQMGKAMAGMFNACLDEAMPQKALGSFCSFVSGSRYPQAKSLHTVVKSLLLPSTSASMAYKTFNALQRVLDLHPPSTSTLQNMYLAAIRGPDTENPEDTPPAWDVLDTSIQIVLSSDETISEQQRLNHRLFLKFVAATMETDFTAIQRNITSNRLKENVRHSLWAKVMWPQGPVSKTNTACKHLLTFLVEAHRTTTTGPLQMEMLQILHSLVALTVQCCRLVSDVSTSVPVSPQCVIMARELAFLIQGHLGEDTKPLHCLLMSLKLPWLRLLVTQTLLDSYDDSLLVLPEPNNQQQLSLKLIVSHHFFLLPKLTAQAPSSPHCKMLGSAGNRTPVRRTQQKLPLRPLTLSTSSQNTISPKPSPHKSPTKSPATLARKAITINKRNFKGETALHRACIKNNVLRVRELLQMPGIDVNVADNAGWTALHEASNHGSIECMAELLRYRPPKTISSYFSQGSDNSRKVNLLAANEDGITPLHDAVINHQVEASRLLLQYGGPQLLKIETKAGKTPLDLAGSDMIRDILTTSAGRHAKSSPFGTPHKRRARLMATDDSQNSSQNSSQDYSQNSSQSSFIDSQGLDDPSMMMPQEEVYDKFLSVSAASADHCLTYLILLQHLVGSYMTIHQTQDIKANLRNRSLPCRLPSEDCVATGRSHVMCLCHHLAGTLGTTAGHLEEDLGVIRQWSHHQSNLSSHLDRISKRQVSGDMTFKAHLMALSQFGAVN